MEIKYATIQQSRGTTSCSYFIDHTGILSHDLFPLDNAMIELFIQAFFCNIFFWISQGFWPEKSKTSNSKKHHISKT
jgi:hypothetical protein